MLQEVTHKSDLNTLKLSFGVAFPKQHYVEKKEMRAHILVCESFPESQDGAPRLGGYYTLCALCSG